MSDASHINPFIFWAKTSHDKDRPRAYHPLLCHMIDVAVVARVLWHQVLPQAARLRIAHAFGLETDSENLTALVAWIAGLHDLGKASPPFTLRETKQNLRRLYENTPLAMRREPPPAKEAPHGYVTASELPSILHQDFAFPVLMAEHIGVLIGGHHGVFPRSQDTIKIQGDPKYCGDQNWLQARRTLTHELARLLSVPRPFSLPKNALLDNATIMLLAGLVSVADWIGSNASYFACAIEDFDLPPDLDALSYQKHAEMQAQQALSQLGWLGWPEMSQGRAFDELFPNIKEINPLQKAAFEIAASLNSPGIVVIESPMGEGKTEAAMCMADHWNVSLRQRGIYFALPTQATSNQMFGRVRQFLDNRFETGTALLHLLHGHAALSAEFQTLLDEGKRAFDVLNVQSVCDDAVRNHADGDGNVVAAEWFTHRKRGLLTPFGVGTVDQALLAVLHTRHVFVRLFGLAHKTVIVDEVHAYDAYMSALLERLLSWLAALGSPVLLLSATLPSKRRGDLIRAYLRGLGAEVSELSNQREDHYPRITWATKDIYKVRHVPASARRTLYLRPETLDHTQLGEKLQKALQPGGCVAVICNTVQRAQDVYEAIKPFFPGDADDDQPTLDLLHARFLFKDRAAREIRTLIRFGKPDGEVTDGDGHTHRVNRPRRAVLVSTQIIEQSLDLDFDLMVTELAPVDLMLQRAGRLHRHKRDDRPHGLEEPTLWIGFPPTDDNDAPDFGKSRYVYNEHILLRSLLALTGREQIVVPDEIEELIEFVYDAERECPQQALVNLWNGTKAKLLKELEDKEGRAKSSRIKSPYYEGLFEDFNPELEEDNPKFDRSMRALTRDDEIPNITAIFLRPEERDRIAAKDLSDLRFLLERSVNIAKRGATELLIEQPPPSQWRDSPLLRHHRLVELDEDGKRLLGDYLFHLHPDLGLIITDASKEKA